MRFNLTGLWRHREFMRLWAAQGVSELGSRVARDGLPLAALLTLHAGPAHVGALAAATTAPRVLVGVLAGGFVDRARRRPVMIAADLLRAALLGTVPAAALLHVLTLAQIYVVAFLVGASSTIFDIEGGAYYPTLVREDQLVEGNTKFSITVSIANVGGPALAGVLIQALTAPIAIAATSLSYLGSAALLTRIRTEEPSGRLNDARQWWRDLRNGIGLTLRHPLGRPLWGMGTVAGMFVAMFGALYPFIALQELHLTPAMLGLTFAAGGMGALAGAAVRPRLTRRFGVGPVALGAALLAGMATLAIPLTLAPPATAAILLGAAQFAGDALTTISGITMATLGQLIFPTAKLGRVGSFAQVSGGAAAMTGSLLGGSLGAAIGPRQAALVAASGLTASIALGLLSPLRRLRELPPQATA